MVCARNFKFTMSYGKSLYPLHKTGCADKLTNKHKKKADTVSQLVRPSCKNPLFRNNDSCRILKL